MIPTHTYSLQLLLLLDQELQHQVDICQVQVLLVRTQHILEHLPPRAVLWVRDPLQLGVTASYNNAGASQVERNKAVTAYMCCTHGMIQL